MAQKPVSRLFNLSKPQLWLLAILLSFVILLMITWLWYDIKITSLNKQLPQGGSSQAQSSK